MKLAAKLILILFLAVGALTTAMAYFTIHQQYASFQKGREETARELKDKVSDLLTKAWKEGGREGVDDALASMSLEIRQTEMRWVQFNADGDHPDAPTAPMDSLPRVLEGKIESVVIRHNGGEERLHTFFQVPGHADDRVGVELSDSLAPLKEQERRTVYSTIMTLLGLSLVCVGVVVFAGLQLVGHPLEKLVGKTRQIADGDYSQPVHVPGHDELSRLGAALNHLSDRLCAQKQTIDTETAARIAALNQLRHADRLKTVGRLAAGIAHELGTPLNVVSGRAGLIANGRLSNDEVRQSAVTIKSEADRITHIIRQLLDFARRTELQRQTVDLSALATRTAELLSTIAEKNHVQLNVNAKSGTVRANIDEAQIQHVLTNIIMNSIQAIAEAGTVNIDIGVRNVTPPPDAQRDTGDYAFIEVRDTGIGMKPDDLEQIFEPFFTTKDVGEGTGLGLSIAYGIIQEHGGWIDVQSESGSGSCFTLYLPKETEQ
ncbi:MAG: HAMP domain-containing protein [Planctomycetales bacterium]|nr:HAMP domain-containing protein [Planctomycetales bacterium]